MKKLFVALSIACISFYAVKAEESEAVQRLRAQIAANKCPWRACRNVGADIYNSGICFRRVTGYTEGIIVLGPLPDHDLHGVEDLTESDRKRPGDAGECARLVALQRQLRMVRERESQER